MHCLQDTPGADFHPALQLPDDAVKISKGVRLDKDQHSAFDETGLGAYMRERRIRRVWIGGLAEDVCVRSSALDGSKEGFEVHVILDATRPVNPDARPGAHDEMRAAGVILEPARS